MNVMSEVCHQGKGSRCAPVFVFLQVSLPVVKVEGCPVGLSLMGPRGSDEKLLQLTEKLMALFTQ